MAFLLFSLIKDMPVIGDEGAHEQQIRAFIRWLADGEPFTPSHPALPGYHALLAFATFLTGASSIPVLRFLSLAINVVGLVAAYQLSLALSRDRCLSIIRMAQVFVLSVAFPFFFLIYTDILSALVVLLALAFLFRGHPLLAGLVGTLSIVVRQNNVLWLGLAYLLACTQVSRTGDLSARGIAATLEAPAFWRRTAIFLPGFVLFGLFVLWNGGGIALADKAAHPPFSFHTGNVWGFLFTAFIVFFPYAVAQSSAISALWRRRPGRVLLFSGALFLVYMATYTNSHFYNFNPWWLRNKVTMLTTSTPYWKALFFVPILYQTFVFVTTPFWRRSLYLLYPVAGVYLASSWLIEPRYYFIPLFLFLLFRKLETRDTEIQLVLWNVPLAFLLFNGALQRLYLP